MGEESGWVIGLGDPMRVGDCEALLNADVRALLDRTQNEWREVPLERAQELAMNARAENDQAVSGLSERMALVQAIGVEIEKGRPLGFDVLDDAVLAAYGAKPATEFLSSEKNAIADVVQRIWNRVSITPSGSASQRVR